LDFDKDSSVRIWQGSKIKSISLSADGTQTVFSAADGTDSSKTAIWLYKSGETKAKKSSTTKMTK